jgi:DNA-directed RNA polymerase
MATTGNKASVVSATAKTKGLKKATTRKVVVNTADTAKRKSTASSTKVKATNILKKAVAKTAIKKSVETKNASTVSNPFKKATVKKSIPTKKNKSVTPEQRYQMIATAAYFLAERRGFAGGYEMQDWIAAEAETDVKLAT